MAQRPSAGASDSCRWLVKIAIVTPYDLSTPGGVNAYARTAAGWMRAQGHEVRTIGPASNGLTSTDERVVVGGVRRLPVGGTRVAIGLRRGNIGALNAHFESERYDVVHLQEPLMPLIGPGTMRSQRAPIVGTFHGAERMGRWLSRAAGSRIAGLLPGLALGRGPSSWTDRLAVTTAVSTVARDNALPFAGDATIVPCPIDVATFACPAGRPAALCGPGPHVLFVGRAERRKGLPSLLLAMKRLRRLRARDQPARLIVAGPLDRPMEAMRKRAARLGVDATFVGAIPHAELPAYYQHADVCCFPATGGEAFGIVLGEAMAAGTPVVGVANPGYRGVARNDEEGLLVPLVSRGDAQSMAGRLAEALARVLDDRTLAQRLSDAGRRRAADFDIETVGPRLLELYDRAQGGRRV